MSINADSEAIRQTAGGMVNSYIKIVEETDKLNREVSALGETMDDAGFSEIVSSVNAISKRLNNSAEIVKTLCMKLVEYAKIIDKLNKHN